jgi:hypothetical protein
MAFMASSPTSASPSASAQAGNQDDDLFTPKPGYYFIFGPPGAGKTFSALRGSLLFPKERLAWPTAKFADAPRVQLEDTLHLAFDLGAGSGLEAMGIDVPTLDMRAVCDKYSSVDAWKAMPDLFRKAKARYPNITQLVTDTVSALDDLMLAWWYENMPNSDKGKEDTQKMWTGLAACHTHWRDYITKAAMSEFRARPTILCHAIPKFKGAGDRAKVAEKQMEAQNVEDGDLIPRITGKSGDAYIKDADFVYWCDFVTEPGTNKRKYLYYGEKKGVATKNRFAHLTGTSWDADMDRTLRMIGRRR